MTVIFPPLSIKEFQIINLALVNRRERFSSKPPPKPPIQRRRAAQTGAGTGAGRKGNGLAERGREGATLPPASLGATAPPSCKAISAISST